MKKEKLDITIEHKDVVFWKKRVEQQTEEIKNTKDYLRVLEVGLKAYEQELARVRKEVKE